MSEGLTTLGFVSLFHIIGGIAIGVGLRRLFRGISCQPVFFLVWGGLFGGMPLFIGAAELAAKGQLLFFSVEIVILVATILLVALTPDWIAEAFRSQSIYLMLFGSIFLIVGIGAGLAAWQEQFVTGLILILVFGGTGALILMLGFRMLLKEK